MSARVIATVLVGAFLTAGSARAAPSPSQQDDGCEVVRQISESRANATLAGGFLTGVAEDGSSGSAWDCPTPDNPVGVAGNGGGGHSRCTPTPVGDLAEVHAVYAAVNAQQTPDPTNTAFVEDELQNPSGPDRVVHASWYRINGTSVQVLFNIECHDPPEQYSRWMDVVPDSAGNLVPQVRAIDLVPALTARVVRQLPTPVPRVGPADEDPHGWTYVQHRTFFWVDQAPGQWETVSGTASAGGISVSVQAVPERLVVDPGDGSEPVVCDGVPTAVTKAAYYPDIEGCSYRYHNSSAMAPNGEAYPVTVTVVWHASWSASTGEGGDLGYISTSSPVRELQVAEVQSVITDNNP